ncbi:hypothetical protein INS49_004925 [Diaporthe citri]|uniref:uncharacterized protein n=1 Tax=Diaporthe citri TaxID=83186 RepID=UPI001C81DC1B|nr:uncharacterized protein INS49_004925 [Diaporthe citri]KAG6354320.1 hypothetical protein INS49_004925 [Diaporthe citri]
MRISPLYFYDGIKVGGEGYIISGAGHGVDFIDPVDGITPGSIRLGGGENVAVNVALGENELFVVGKGGSAAGAADKYKVGPNYAPSIVPGLRPKRHGLDQYLWLIGDDSPTTEATGMDMFAVVEERGAGTDTRDPRAAASRP